MTCMTWLGTTRIMLSVGKDRTLFLLRLRPNRSFELFTSLPKAHSRVIWACAPVFLHSRVLKVDGTSQEMAVFVTVSRDCSGHIYGVTEEGAVRVREDMRLKDR